MKRLETEYLPTITSKQPQRDKLAKDTELFLKAGGHIQQIPYGVSYEDEVKLSVSQRARLTLVRD